MAVGQVLRQAVGGERVVQADGATVGEVLNDLCTRHPAVGAQILTADGTLHKYVNLYVNDEDARLLQWTDTPVGDADTLMILPAMAGGAFCPKAASTAKVVAMITSVLPSNRDTRMTRSKVSMGRGGGFAFLPAT